MNKFEEFESKKFLIILFLICALFFVLIITAFQYIPDQKEQGYNRNNAEYVENSNQPADSEVRETEENSNAEEAVTTEEEPVEVKKPKKELNIALPKFGNDKSELENIEELPAEAAAENEDQTIAKEEKPVELSKEDQVDKIFLTAQKYKNSKQYVKAIEEYQKISALTNDVQANAKSLEEIATIYAIVKRYGTALSYAQKAYNMSPSSSREMLLARLYYKTGDIDKATRRINNVLQRDFSSDR